MVNKKSFFEVFLSSQTAFRGNPLRGQQVRVSKMDIQRSSHAFRGSFYAVRKFTLVL